MEARRGWDSDFRRFNAAVRSQILSQFSLIYPDPSDPKVKSWRQNVSMLQRDVGEIVPVRTDVAAFTAILAYELPMESRPLTSFCLETRCRHRTRGQDHSVRRRYRSGSCPCPRFVLLPSPGFTGTKVEGAYGLQKIGVEHVKPFFTRGHLINVKPQRAWDRGEEIIPDHMQAPLAARRMMAGDIKEGDAVRVQFLARCPGRCGCPPWRRAGCAPRRSHSCRQ